MLIHRDNNPIQGRLQFARDGLNDTEVDLMWNQSVDIRLLHAVAVRRERLFNDAGKGGDRYLEQLGPLHLQI